MFGTKVANCTAEQAQVLGANSGRRARIDDADAQITYHEAHGVIPNFQERKIVADFDNGRRGEPVSDECQTILDTLEFRSP